MTAHDDKRVDELREQLRALGYLDARVDRFVLAGAGPQRHPAALITGASARIGLLAGVLLGPAAAIGLGARVPNLVTGPVDALVLAAYLAALFGVATGLVAAASIFLGTLLARRSSSHPSFGRLAKRAATVAGLAVGVACLLYLTLWWQTAAGIAGAPSLLWSAVAITVAVAISLLLGHAVALTVLAVLAGLGLAAALTPGRPMTSAKATAPLALFGLIGAIALLVLSSPSPRATSTGPALTVVSTGERVTVIAIDGVDPATVDRLRTAGRLPAIDRALRQGVATMASDVDRDPARVWTTIATGQPADRHGVRALQARQVPGLEGRLQAEPGFWAPVMAATDLVRLTRPAIASGNDRRIPAFWEVAARAGLRTAVIHWWATWPAPADLGTVLTDRAILRLEQEGPLDAEIAPPELYDTLRASAAARRAAGVARARAAETTGAPGDISSAVRRSAELDATIVELALTPAMGAPDLLVLYLPGLDIVQHTLFEPGRADLGPSGAAERVAALEQYYVFLDRAVADLSGREKGLVVLVTQPGRVAAPANGLLALSGSIAATGRTEAPITAVAATVLHALGVPIASDLASGPVTGLFAPSFLDRYPVRSVTTYGLRGIAGRGGSGRPLDAEMIERMRSLGYVR